MPRFMVSSARVLFYVLSALTMHSALAKDSDALSGPALHIETFNLRYDNPADGANAWPKRQNIVKQHILETHPDVIGMQEVLVHQLNWLQESLPAYTAIGVGRDDGKEKGEFVPILFNHEQVTLLDKGHFWLSETPDVVGSVGWEAHLPRIVTWVKLSKQQREFYVFNIHFSHVSELARQKSAEFLVKYIPEIAHDIPVILTGDFNAQDQEYAYKVLTEKYLDSARAENAEIKGTFNGWGRETSAKRIDYIFYSPDLHAADYQTHEIEDAGVYISDHYPVSVTIQ